MAERLLRAKARQSLIERSELAEILLIYVLRIFVYYMYTYKVNVLCIKFSDMLAYFYALDLFIEIRLSSK